METKRRLKLSNVRNRPAQKVRDDLLAAALRIMDQGDKLTIAAAAKEVGVSTGTAYRHFADSSTLMIKAIQQQQTAIRGDIFENLRREFAHIDNIEDRVLLVHRVSFDLARRHEGALRMFLAKSLMSRIGSKDRVLDLGDVRRMTMFEMALEPLERNTKRKCLADLVLALSAASGMETYTTLKDLCGLNDDEIDRIIRFNLLAIFRAAMSACHETQ